jgi:hypothetical protein
MSCNSCQSDNQHKFNCEIALHFPGLKGLDKPIVLTKGIKPTMARLTLARKIAAIALILWKKGEDFDAEKLKLQAA